MTAARGRADAACPSEPVAASRAGAGVDRAQWLFFPLIVAVGLAPQYVSYIGVATIGLYLLKTTRIPRANTAIVFAALLLLLAALSLLWTIDSARTTTSVILGTGSVAIFVVIVHDIVHRGSWIDVVRMIAATGAILSVAFLLFAERRASEWSFITGDYGRYSFSFVGTNYTAYAISTGCAATIVLLVRRAAPIPRKWLLAGVVAVAVDAAALFRTETRGAQLGVALAVITALAGLRWARGSLVICVVVLLAAAAISLTGGLAAIGSDLGLSASADARGFSGRDQLYASAIEVLAQQPVLGYGLDAYTSLLWGEIGAHNLFMSITLSLGGVGLAIYLLLLLRIFWPWPSSRADDDQAIQRADGDRLRLRATFLAASIPVWSTGVWEWSPFNWVMLSACAGAAALGSQVLRTPHRNRHRPSTTSSKRPLRVPVRST